MLMLDEVVNLHRALPEHLESISAGVEQATFGLNAAWKYPTVWVCRSAAKLYFESQIMGFQFELG